MNEQQWEFCCLQVSDFENVKGKGQKWAMDIVYMAHGDRGQRSVTLATKEGSDAKVWPYPPFYIAMGLLGSFGWEPVSIQHGTSGSYGYGGGKNLWYDVVAWFKRPVVAGRRVDEPKLILP